jgi:hypothetical protein
MGLIFLRQPFISLPMKDARHFMMLGSRIIRIIKQRRRRIRFRQDKYNAPFHHQFCGQAVFFHGWYMMDNHATIMSRCAARILSKQLKKD